MATESTGLFTSAPNSTIDEAFSSVPTLDPIASIGVNLRIYWSPVLVLGGTITNGLSLFVLMCPEFRHTTMAFTLSALAVSDTGVLYTGALRRWALALTANKLDFMALSLPFCRTSTFFHYLFSQLSSWSIVLVTVERVIAVRFPFRAKSLCTRCKMICAWCVILVTQIAFNAHILWNAVIIHQEDRMYCGFEEEDTIVYWIDFVLLASLPCTIILISNIVIIVTLAKQRTKRLRQQNSETNSPSDSRQNMPYKSLTLTTVVVSVVFILTTLPVTIYFLVIPPVDKLETPKQAARPSLAQDICQLLYYTSNAINFFLYVLTGQGFRRAFMKQLIKFKCCRQKSPHQNDDIPLQAVLPTPGGVPTFQREPPSSSTLVL